MGYNIVILVRICKGFVRRDKTSQKKHFFSPACGAKKFDSKFTAKNTHSVALKKSQGIGENLQDQNPSSRKIPENGKKSQVRNPRAETPYEAQGD